MNKKAKGAIAAGAAAILLLGGLGTLAFWNDEESVEGDQISSGELALTPGDSDWYDNSDTPATVITNIDDFLIVPGDEIEYVATFTLDAKGNNLTADLSVSLEGLSGGPGGDALVNALVPTVTAEQVGGTPPVTVTLPSDGTTVPITNANDGDVINLSLTLLFPFGTVPDNTTQNGTVDLSGLAVTLTQTAN